MSEEGSENNILKGDEEVGGEEIFERNKKDYNEENACGNDDSRYGHGVGRTYSNIVGKHEFKW